MMTMLIHPNSKSESALTNDNSNNDYNDNDNEPLINFEVIKNLTIIGNNFNNRNTNYKVKQYEPIKTRYPEVNDKNRYYIKKDSPKLYNTLNNNNTKNMFNKLDKLFIDLRNNHSILKHKGVIDSSNSNSNNNNIYNINNNKDCINKVWDYLGNNKQPFIKHKVNDKPKMNLTQYNCNYIHNDTPSYHWNNNNNINNNNIYNTEHNNIQYNNSNHINNIKNKLIVTNNNINNINNNNNSNHHIPNQITFITNTNNDHNKNRSHSKTTYMKTIPPIKYEYHIHKKNIKVMGDEQIRKYIEYKDKEIELNQLNKSKTTKQIINTNNNYKRFQFIKDIDLINNLNQNTNQHKPSIMNIKTTDLASLLGKKIERNNNSPNTISTHSTPDKISFNEYHQ